MSRPKAGDNPLAIYASDSHAARRSKNAAALRVLAREAVKRGFNLTSFAELLSKDRTTIAAYFRAVKPSAEVIEHISRALLFPPIVARALLGDLDDRDVRNIRGSPSFSRSANRSEPHGAGWSIQAMLFERRDMIDDFDEQYELFERAWPALTPDRRRAAAAAFVLACEGLSTEGSGPLAALQHELAKDGHVLAIAERVERREAAIAFRWLTEAASLSTLDQEKLWATIGMRLGAAHPIEIEPRADHIVNSLRDTLRRQIGAKR